MGIWRRILIFVAPIILAAICKATLASAAGGAELDVYSREPAKLIDVSIDLLLTATSILLGVLLYVQAGGTLTRPGTTGAQPQVRTTDVVICGFIQIAALILIFGSTIGLPHIPFIKAHFNTLATIWLPDLVGFFAFMWVVVKLT
jgi:hypothetical protein